MYNQNSSYFMGAMPPQMPSRKSAWGEPLDQQTIQLFRQKYLPENSCMNTAAA